MKNLTALEILVVCLTCLFVSYKLGLLKYEILGFLIYMAFVFGLGLALFVHKNLPRG